MVQVYTLFCLAVFALFLLQSIDAHHNLSNQPHEKNPDQSPFLRKVDRIVNSDIVQKATKVAEHLGKEVKKAGHEFEHQLNTEYVLDRNKNSRGLIPKSLKYNVVQPSTVGTKVLIKTTASLVGDMASYVEDQSDKRKKQKAEEANKKIGVPSKPRGIFGRSKPIRDHDY